MYKLIEILIISYQDEGMATIVCRDCREESFLVSTNFWRTTLSPSSISMAKPLGFRNNVFSVVACAECSVPIWKDCWG